MPAHAPREALQEQEPLQDQVALVTGAGRDGGIGAACAARLARAGARVVLTDLPDSEGEAQAAGLRAQGAQALFVPLDVCSETQWRAAVAGAVDHFGGLDVLVNNAGVEVLKPILDTTLEDWRQVQAVNMEGVFLGVREAMAAMQPGGAAGRGGAIVNISSVAGLIGIPGVAAYSASKAGVRMLTKVAAMECGRFGYGIRVNSIHPGVVETRMGSAALDGFVDLGLCADRQEATAWAKSVHPLGCFGQPSDIAEAVMYLASDASRWVTGIELVVDGGWTAH